MNFIAISVITSSSVGEVQEHGTNSSSKPLTDGRKITHPLPSLGALGGTHAIRLQPRRHRPKEKRNAFFDPVHDLLWQYHKAAFQSSLWQRGNTLHIGDAFQT